MIRLSLVVFAFLALACDDPVAPPPVEPSAWVLSRIDGENVPGVRLGVSASGDTMIVTGGTLQIDTDRFPDARCPASLAEAPLSWHFVLHYEAGGQPYQPPDFGCVIGDRFYSYLYARSYGIDVRDDRLRIHTPDFTYEFAPEH